MCPQKAPQEVIDKILDSCIDKTIRVNEKSYSNMRCPRREWSLLAENIVMYTIRHIEYKLHIFLKKYTNPNAPKRLACHLSLCLDEDINVAYQDIRNTVYSHISGGEFYNEGPFLILVHPHDEFRDPLPIR